MDCALPSVNTTTMAEFLQKMFAKIKIWIAWLWTYLWALWFLLVVFVVYILRGPLRIGENITSGEVAVVSASILVILQLETEIDDQNSFTLIVNKLHEILCFQLMFSVCYVY